MLSTIIDKLNESDPKTEGCSFLMREVSFKDIEKETESQYKKFVRAYAIRILFSGEELSATEKYMTEFIGTFRCAFDEDNKSALPYEVKVLKGATGQLILPSHEGAKYKISVNITVEV